MNLFKKAPALFTLILLIPTSLALAFTDVSPSNPHNDAIQYLQQKGVIQGYSDGTFRPDSPINRAEFLKILLEAKSPGTAMAQSQSYCFPDVADAWYSPYVCYAKSRGIVGGYPDGNFRPANNINLAEALKMVLETYGIEMKFFRTADTKWYEPYYWTAEPNGWLDGINHDIGHAVTRGEMAQLILGVENNFTNDEILTYSSIYENENQEAQFLIITNSKLISVGDTLAESRTQEGLSTIIQVIEKLPLSEQENMLNWLGIFKNQHPNLKYLLLLGDSDSIPSFQSESPIATQTTATDFPYTLNYSLRVGRVPAKNLLEAENFMRKVEKYNPYSKNIFQFGTSAEIEAYGETHENEFEESGFSAEVLRPTNHQEVANYFNNGFGFSIFYGHGSWMLFYDAFNISDIELLNNSESPTVLFSGGCDTVNYTSEESSIAEKFLTGENGAVAVIGATRDGGYGYNYEFLPSFFENCSQQRLGDTFQVAVEKNMEATMNSSFWNLPESKTDWTNYFQERMTLLGDPTMKICQN